MTSLVKIGREGQRKIANAQLAAAQKVLDSIAEVEKAEAPIIKKDPPTCFLCGQPPKAWGDRGAMGIQSTIGGLRALCHVQTQALGEGCWQLMTRAKSNVLMMKGVKIGPHGKYNKGLADELLVVECARMMAIGKNQANVAAQFEPTGGGSKKSGQALVNAKVATELAELRRRTRGGQAGNDLAQAHDQAVAEETVAQREASRTEDIDIEFRAGESDYNPPAGSWADQVQREADEREARDRKKHSYTGEVTVSEGGSEGGE